MVCLFFFWSWTLLVSSLEQKDGKAINENWWPATRSLGYSSCVACHTKPRRGEVWLKIINNFITSDPGGFVDLARQARGFMDKISAQSSWGQ